jgi:hypothetical protein
MKDDLYKLDDNAPLVIGAFALLAGLAITAVRIIALAFIGTCYSFIDLSGIRDVLISWQVTLWNISWFGIWVTCNLLYNRKGRGQ